jgi:hypothetical protein
MQSAFKTPERKKTMSVCPGAPARKKQDDEFQSFNTPKRIKISSVCPGAPARKQHAIGNEAYNPPSPISIPEITSDEQSEFLTETPMPTYRSDISMMSPIEGHLTPCFIGDSDMSDDE